uniref:Tyrosine-protein phosphatase domain-containing protein n=1 Tax=Steinernema glaseri TaxID=37863 RepID=A0A1I8AUM0_9BILA
MTSPLVIERDCGRISRIRPYLYLSGIGPLSPQNLQKFSCVINCIAGFRHVAPSHLTVLHIPIEDEESTDLAPYWQLVFQTIEANKKLNGKVLIFCGMGISRSPTFVMAYLVCIERMSLLDAYKYIQARRNIVCPNIGFFRQLIELEEKISGKRTVSIIQPIAGLEVADVVWNELYDEVMQDLQKKAVTATATK